ncbi:olfactory receptor-like protein OLF1 [Bombina bombina]|uniref:olfactory receptor-like protein OLF1 n=1 Tax=Bombina bombina TaxID=8345 RepID=UPI00235AF638|nr:olfactory receptor-like protein OLF1 [Bombina bombina]
MANFLIILLGCSYPHLHKPMFFFLINLSLSDMCFSSVTLPWAISSLVTQNRSISLAACVLQMYGFLAFTSTEFLLLSAMAYDRYVAICYPLHYSVSMNHRVCLLLAIFSWLLGFADTFPHAWFAFVACYCDSNKLNHFFCDLTALLKLSCTGTSLIEMITYIEGIFLGFGPFFLTLTSYIFIINTIFKIQSSDGRSKAFSTCSSHLIVVMLFYGTTLSIYMRPTSVFSMEANKRVTLAYALTIPLLNPIIYSLRNNELKGALKKFFQCSLDLLLLVVEEVRALLNKVKDEIVTFDTTKGPTLQQDQSENWLNKLTQQLKEYKDYLMAFKNKKLQQVIEDYRERQVYKWTLSPEERQSFRPRQPRHQRVYTRRQLNTVDTSSGSDTDSPRTHEYAGPSTSELHFLGVTTRSSHRKKEEDHIQEGVGLTGRPPRRGRMRRT